MLLSRFKLSRSQVWSGVLSLVFLVLFGLFLRSERQDIHALRLLLPQTRLSFLGIGVLVTLAYIVLQGQFYRYCYQITGHTFPLVQAIQLYLKRFFLSSFIPAGATVSQYTFTKDMKAHDIGEMESHLTATLYLLIGATTYIVLLIPTLLYLLITSQLTVIMWLASGLVIVMTLLLALCLVAVMHGKGFVFRFVQRSLPDVVVFLNTWKHRSLKKKALGKAFLSCILTNFLLILLLWLVFACLGVSSSWFLALVGYVVTILVLTISPIFQGIGLVEFSLVYILVQFGLDRQAAVGVTLLYRSLQLWLPFVLGLILVVYQRATASLKEKKT